MNDKKRASFDLKLGAAAPRGLYFLIFAVSGFSGLIYESIWSHYLKLFLGHAAYAQSLVLMIFMGGMAAGSWIASRMSRRSRIPILVYAVAELVVGVLALVFHGVFTGMMEAFYNTVLPSMSAPAAGAILKWLAASLLITPQSILLGMTFPLMSAGIIRRYPDAPGGSLSMLYFTNSLGAAIGVLASGFLMIGALGLPGTIMTAGLLNIALAITVWILVSLDPQAETAPLPETKAATGALAVGNLFLVAAFITGAASFIYEIGWIRMLSLVLGATTHSFELMLSAFITGLAFGGLWIKRRIDRIADPVRFSARVQLLMGVLAILTIPVYLLSFDWMSWLYAALQKNDAGFAAFSMASHAIALTVMLPTTFLAGMTLPLFTFVLIQRGHGEASIGRIYAANTLGAITGVLFAVHIGLPLLGLKHLVAIGALLDIGLGLYLLARTKVQGQRSPRLAAAALLGLGAVALTLGLTDLDKDRLVSGVYRSGLVQGAEGDEIVYYQDGKTASVSLRLRADGLLILATNGKPDAAIQLNPAKPASLDELTMLVAGTLPIAYLPDAKRIANIGLGSGQTTHALLASPDIEVVDTIEIEPAIVAASRNYGPHVSRAYTDPRSNIYIEDAKTFFSLHHSVYDIIVAEPSNPWVSGVASLFSSQFYRTVLNHLSDDGLFVQWIQLYEFNDELAVSILKALTENFEDYVVYTTDGFNILLIAKKQGRLPAPEWPALFDSQFAVELERINIRSPEDFLIRKVATRDTMLPLLMSTRTPVNSDYFPYVDLNAGRARFKETRAEMFSEWGKAPIPMLEMLFGDRLKFPELAGSDLPPRLRDVNTADFLHDRLLHLPATADYIDGKLALQADWVDAAIATCAGDWTAERWRIEVHRIMRSSLAFLDSAEGHELIDAVAVPACARDAQDYEHGWLDLYRALADRDPGTIFMTGGELLQSDADAPLSMKSYALGATMLAAIAAGNAEAADAVWQQEGAAIYDADHPVPEHIRLLRSMAMYTAHDFSDSAAR